MNINELDKSLEEQLSKLKYEIGKIEESNKIAKNSSVRLDIVSEDLEQLKKVINTTKGEVNQLKDNQTNFISKEVSEQIEGISEKYDLLRTIIDSTKVEINQLIENQRNAVALDALKELKVSLELNIGEIKIEKKEYDNQLHKVKNSVIELVAVKDNLIERLQEIEKKSGRFVNVDNFNSSLKISENTIGKIILEIEDFKLAINTITKNIDGLYKFLGEIDKTTIKKLENSTKNSFDLIYTQIADVKSLLSKYTTSLKFEKSENDIKLKLLQYQAQSNENGLMNKKSELRITSLEKKNRILGMLVTLSFLLALISLVLGLK